MSMVSGSSKKERKKPKMDSELYSEVVNKVDVGDGQMVEVKYKMLNTEKVLGYINKQLYTDVESWAVLKKSGKKMVVVPVSIPLARCYNKKAAREKGVPDGIAIDGEPFEVVYKWKKWRYGNGRNEFLSSIEDPVVPYCGYYYDLHF